MIGTTTIGTVYGDGYNGGVVLAADSRCSGEDKDGKFIVFTNQFVKILKLSETTYACVSGNADHAERVYYCFDNILRMWECVYGSFLVRDMAGLVSFAIAQDKNNDVAFMVGGWDAFRGPQIYFVKKGGVSENLKYKFDGSGARCLYRSNFGTLLALNNSKEIAKQQILEFLNMAVIEDRSTGGQLCTVTIDKTGVVNEVLSESQEAIPKWGWMLGNVQTQTTMGPTLS